MTSRESIVVSISSSYSKVNNNAKREYGTSKIITIAELVEAIQRQGSVTGLTKWAMRPVSKLGLNVSGMASIDILPTLLVAISVLYQP